MGLLYQRKLQQQGAVQPQAQPKTQSVFNLPWTSQDEEGNLVINKQEKQQYTGQPNSVEDFGRKFAKLEDVSQQNAMVKYMTRPAEFFLDPFLKDNKYYKAWKGGQQETRDVGGSIINYLGSELHSDTMKEFSKGYRGEVEATMKKRGLEAKAGQDSWEMGIRSLPNSLAGTAMGVAAGFATKNPKVGQGVMAFYAGLSEAGGAYDEALSKGATEDEALWAARGTGAINGAIEYFLMAERTMGLLQNRLKFLGVAPLKDGIRQGVSTFVMKEGTEAAKSVIGNLIEENTQEFTKNFFARLMYDEQRGLFEGMEDTSKAALTSGIIQHILFRGMGAATSKLSESQQQIKTETTPPSGIAEIDQKAKAISSPEGIDIKQGNINKLNLDTVYQESVAPEGQKTSLSMIDELAQDKGKTSGEVLNEQVIPGRVRDVYNKLLVSYGQDIADAYAQKIGGVESMGKLSQDGTTAESLMPISEYAEKAKSYNSYEAFAEASKAFLDEAKQSLQGKINPKVVDQTVEQMAQRVEKEGGDAEQYRKIMKGREFAEMDDFQKASEQAVKQIFGKEAALEGEWQKVVAEDKQQQEESLSSEDLQKRLEAAEDAEKMMNILPEESRDLVERGVSFNYEQEDVNGMSESDRRMIGEVLKRLRDAGDTTDVVANNIQMLGGGEGGATATTEGGEIVTGEAKAPTQAQGVTPGKAEAETESKVLANEIPESQAIEGEPTEAPNIQEINNRLAKIDESIGTATDATREGFLQQHDVIQARIDEILNGRQVLVSQIKEGKTTPGFKVMSEKMGKKEYKTKATMSVGGKEIKLPSAKGTSHMRAIRAGIVRIVPAIEGARLSGLISTAQAADIKQEIKTANRVLRGNRVPAQQLAKLAKQAREKFAALKKEQALEKKSVKGQKLNADELYKRLYQKIYKKKAPEKTTEIAKEKPGLAKKGAQKAFAIGKKVAVQKATIQKAKEIKKLKEAHARVKANLKQAAEVRRTKNISQLKKTHARVQAILRDKTASDLKARKFVVRYIKENLPLSERGKYLDAVKNAKFTGRKLSPEQRSWMQKLVSRVNEARKNSERKLAAESIVRMKRALPYINLTQQKKFIEATAKISETSISTRTKRQLEKTKEALRKHGLVLPENQMRKLERLDKQSLREMSMLELVALNNKLVQYIREGKLIRQLKQQQYERRVEQKKEAIKNNAKNLDILPPSPLSPSARKTLSLYKKVSDKISTVDLNLLSMDRLFDLMDGGKNYLGVMFKTFKEPVDVGVNKAYKIADEINIPFVEMLKQLKMTDENMERIAIYAYREQKDGMKKLLEYKDMTEERINGIELSENEQIVYLYMRRLIEQMRPLVEATYARTENKQLGEIENYFPMMTSFTESNILSEDIAGDYGLRRVPFGHVKERTGGRQVLQLNAGEVFVSYINKAAYYINMAETIKELNEISRSHRVEVALGQKAQKIVNQWLDVLARRGGITGDLTFFAADQARRNLSIGILGLRVSAMLKQPLSLFNGAAEIGHYAFEGAMTHVISQDWRQFAYDSSSELRRRAGGDPSYIELSENKFLKGIQEKSLWGLQVLDRLTAGGVWTGAYKLKAKQLGVEATTARAHPEAVKYADLVVRKTQATSEFKDLPPAMVNKYRMYTKALFAFQSFMLNNWGYMRHDVKQNLSKNKAKAIQQMTFIALAMMAEAAISHGLVRIKKRDKEEEKKYSYFNALLTSIFSNIPLIGSVTNSFRYGTMPVPIIEWLSKVTASGHYAIIAKTRKTRYKHLLRVAAYLGGLMGLPTDEPRQWLEPRLFGKKKSSGKLNFGSTSGKLNLGSSKKKINF